MSSEKTPLVGNRPSVVHGTTINVDDTGEDSRRTLERITPPHSTETGRSHQSAVRFMGPEAELPEDTGTFGNPYFRFTILFALIVVTISFLPLIVSLAAPKHFAVVATTGMLLFSLVWVWIACNAARNFSRLGNAPIGDWETVLTLRKRKFKHIVVVPCYLDPLPILLNCIDTLEFQKAPEDLVVVVTFELKTPDLDTKIAAVRDRFTHRFGDLLTVVHEVQHATEIPGGCSNKNFALREAYKYVHKAHPEFRRTRYTITTCDTDSKFHPRYFEVLESAYNAENPKAHFPVKYNVWQAPLFYNWNLDERPFFNRVTCLMRMMMMLGGLISFNINPMSIFSYPLELGLAAGFINPRYGVDDIIAKVRWMCCTNSSVPVKLLPLIVISGPTVGTTFAEEVDEWGRQIRRWIVGASESFHYFLIHYRGRPLLSGISWFVIFFTYYGVLLCCAGLFNVFASIPYPWVKAEDYPKYDLGSGVVFDTKYSGVYALLLQLAAFFVAFVLDALGTRVLHLTENINVLRNAFHWLVSPIVLLVYSLIAFVSIVRFIFEGKKMARHDMAAKEGFMTTTQHNEPSEVEHVAADVDSLRSSFVSSTMQKSHKYA